MFRARTDRVQQHLIITRETYFLIQQKRKMLMAFVKTKNGQPKLLSFHFLRAFIFNIALL